MGHAFVDSTLIYVPKEEMDLCRENRKQANTFLAQKTKKIKQLEVKNESLENQLVVEKQNTSVALAQAQQSSEFFKQVLNKPKSITKTSPISKTIVKTKITTGSTDKTLILDIPNPKIKQIIKNSNHPTGNVNITYAVWVKPERKILHGVGMPAMSVIDVGCCSNNARSALLFHSGHYGATVHYIANGNDVRFLEPRLIYNIWTHITLTKNRDQLYVYINGDYAGQNIIRSGQNVFETDIYIGNSPQGKELYKGEIKGLKIWNRVLTNNEILAEYTNTTELIANL
jgi:hypothetical protein